MTFGQGLLRDGSREPGKGTNAEGEPMRKRAGNLSAIVFAVVALAALALVFAGPAQAVNIIEAQSESPQDGWQAGTCKVDPLNQCSPKTPELFFTQAAGHPPVGFTQIITRHEPGLLPGSEVPVGNLKTVLVDLPPGLSVNPQATVQCVLAAGASPATCPLASKVGTSML